MGIAGPCLMLNSSEGPKNSQRMSQGEGKKRADFFSEPPGTWMTSTFPEVQLNT